MPPFGRAPRRENDRPKLRRGIARAPPLDKVAIRVRLEGSSVFGFNRVTLEEVFDRVTGRGRQARCVSIPVKLATRLGPDARRVGLGHRHEKTNHEQGNH